MGRPPAPGDLALTEIHYHPTEPQQGEFVEILNMAQDTLFWMGLLSAMDSPLCFLPKACSNPDSVWWLPKIPRACVLPGHPGVWPLRKHTQLSNGGALSLLNASGDLLLGLKYGDGHRGLIQQMERDTVWFSGIPPHPVR